MNNSDIKLVKAKVDDLVDGVIKHQTWNTTCFLDPTTQISVDKLLSRVKDISYKKAGGYPQAERNIFVIYPDWMELDDELLPLCGLSIEWDGRYNKIGHRDILGSILGLGIKREKVGDIVINESKAQVIIMKDMASYIITNLNKVGRAKIKVSSLDLGDIDIPPHRFNSIYTTVPSMRLDCLASSGFGMSRNKILPYIRDGRVLVNWEPITKPDYQIEEEDLITVRGMGRLRIDSITGLTKKGRLAVVIQKFI